MKGLVCLLADRTEDFSRTVELELSALYGRVMTVDDPEAAERLSAWGVDYITSNILE